MHDPQYRRIKRVDDRDLDLFVTVKLMRLGAQLAEAEARRKAELIDRHFKKEN